MSSLLENLSSELFTAILSFISHSPYGHDYPTLNSLCRTSRILYNLTTPTLYNSFSYHGLQHDLKRLRRFLDTLNWHPDLAAYVTELDLREWGRCARVEDNVGGMRDGVFFEERKKEKEERERERKKGTLMDDKLVGEEGDDADVEDETYIDEDFEEGNWSEDDEDDEFGVDEDGDGDEDEDGISSGELEFLGPQCPLMPLNHRDCIDPKCKIKIDKSLEKEARDLGFEHENILFDRWRIWREYEEEDLREWKENELIVILLSKCQNLRTMYMVLPQVYIDYNYETHVFGSFLENTPALATSETLQKLESLYICSAMWPETEDHPQYELEFCRLLPFMRLPNLKSLYTLTAYLHWDDWPPKPPIDYTPLKHTSNITTLSYDECTLSPYDVSHSLSMFRSLVSFRWTTSPTKRDIADSFVGFQSNFVTALSAHKDTLEHLYFDSRHPVNYRLDTTIRAGPKANMIDSLREYPRLRTLAIDVTSLVGHQNWTPSDLPLVEILPPNLEELTLFVKVDCKRDSDGLPTAFQMAIDNHFFYPAFLTMLRSARNKLPGLRRIKIKFTRDIVYHWIRDVSVKIVICEATLEEARVMCLEEGIELEVTAAVDCNVDRIREVGNTDIPYFQEQIKGRSPGSDW